MLPVQLRIALAGDTAYSALLQEGKNSVPEQRARVLLAPGSRSLAPLATHAKRGASNSVDLFDASIALS